MKHTIITIVSMAIALLVACTSESEPTSVVQVQPTSTATAIAPTATVVPTSTNTPEPTPTPLPPTATHTPEPTATNTPKPTAVHTPQSMPTVMSTDKEIATESQAWDLVIKGYRSQGTLSDVCDGYQAYLLPHQDALDGLLEDLNNAYGDEYVILVTELTPGGFHQAFPEYCNVSGIVPEATFWDIVFQQGNWQTVLCAFNDDFSELSEARVEEYLNEMHGRLVEDISDRYWLETVFVTPDGYRDAMEYYCPNAPKIGMQNEHEVWGFLLNPENPLNDEVQSGICALDLEADDAETWLVEYFGTLLDFAKDRLGSQFVFEEFTLTLDGLREASAEFCPQLDAEAEIWETVLGGRLDSELALAMCFRHYVMWRDREPEYIQTWLDEQADLYNQDLGMDDVVLTIAGYEAAIAQHCPNAKRAVQSEAEAWDLIMGPKIWNMLWLEFSMCEPNRTDTGKIQAPSQETLEHLIWLFGDVIAFGNIGLTEDGFLEAAQLYCVEE